jgi:hypothetical protein
MRSHRILTLATGALALLGSFGSPLAAQAQEQIVEKIPLQYIDARYVAFLLGGRSLPTEGDIWMGRMGGFGGGANGPVGGGVSSGNGILADPSTNSILMLPGTQGNGLLGGQSLYGDPRTNSLLVGPQYGNRGAGSPRGNRVYGVPGSNSLLYRNSR